MLKTFRTGGVHVPENKRSAGQLPVTLPVPEQVMIPLSQHIGAPCKPLVAKGDEVQAGDLIAEAGGFVSAPIHSSVSGTVARIDNVTDAGGYKKPAIIIDVKGDVWNSRILCPKQGALDPARCQKLLDELTPQEIIEKIRQAGIVGLGGAAFPTHVKMTPPAGSKAEVLIVNGAECEPYLTNDHALMLEKTEEILQGIRFLMKAAGVQKAFIGVESNKRDAIERLSQRATAGYPGIGVVALKPRYPQGGEKQLIDAILRRQVASGALPVSVGAIVQNVGTVFAACEAIVCNKPLIERVVTLTGPHLKNPCNLRVRIGTPIRHLIEYAGDPGDTGKIVGGGPLMGRALVNTQVPVTKGTSGVLLIPASQARRKPARNCIRCAQCVAGCCMGLEPYRLMNLAEFKEWEAMKQNHVMDCLECGSCSFVCPARRPILDYIKWGKTELRTAIKQ